MEPRPAQVPRGASGACEEVSADDVQITFRIPIEWLARADEEATYLSRPGFQASRTDALRAAIAQGFEAFARDRKRKHK